ncbi:hypothetical protein [Paenibacillus hexagrammi]|uniref:Phage protein n=1 Tax=Paenibacillus hexagrammi TaxID=2908839 RepID=A0ABY3SRH8_9BACL|nr:hypothetical protein [Paenibacillus sp. YPD9-1]UJF36554.1 hypothetical protein L0M14_30670 [Paenibacillus sp. YPD9-1]
MRQEIVNIYQFNELEEAAKEKARQWYRNGDYIYTDGITESFEETVRERGLELSGKHPVSWSLGYCQSDYVGIDAEASVELIHRMIEADVSDRDMRWFKRLVDVFDITATTSHHHYYGQRFEVEVLAPGQYPGPIQKLADRIHAVLEQAWERYVRDLCHDLMKYGYAEIEYQSADEQVDESIICNEYEFTEDGARW